MLPTPAKAPCYPEDTRVRVTNQQERHCKPVPFSGEWETVGVTNADNSRPYLVRAIDDRRFTFWVGAVEPIIRPVTDEEMAYVRQSLGLPQ